MSRRSTPLPRSFYARPTLTVARSLLGTHLVRRLNGRRLVGKIVEVEAYIGFDDPGSHAYRGETKRNAVMFGPPGRAYVYFTYGMHFCFNVVTEREGFPAAVLLRAVEPEEGIEVMKKLRGRPGNDVDVANGPAKFCQAFAIDRGFNNEDLLGDTLFILPVGSRLADDAIESTPRVGLREGVEFPWRFYIKGNPYVSKGKPLTSSRSSSSHPAPRLAVGDAASVTQGRRGR